MSTRLVLASTLAFAAACTAPQAPSPLDLRAATGQADVAPSGIAVDPTGARYLYDDNRGLYRFDASGAFELVLARAAMPDPGMPVQAPFTDLVAIGPGRFAITARGEGFLLDLGLGTLRPYFGDAPVGLPAADRQRIDAISYDPDAQLLYAQRRTFDAAGAPLGAQVTSYALATGISQESFAVLGDVAGRGMAMVPGVDGPVLGVSTALCTLPLGRVREVIDLAPLGIVRIDGLAVDRVAGTLLIVDGDSDRLLELALADVFR